MTPTEMIQDPRWDRQLEEMAADVPGASPEFTEELKRWSAALREDVAETLASAAEDEHPVLIAAAWMQMKSQWLLLNTRIGYEIQERHEASPATIIKAAIVAMLVGAFERHLDIGRLPDFAEFLTGHWTPAERAA